MRRHVATARAACAVAMLTVPAAAQRPASAIVLPAPFAPYQTWTTLLETPRPVSQRLWMQCMMPTEAQWEQERAVKGPHADRYVMVYGNAGAVAGLKPDADRFPVGTVIAKEKRVFDEATVAGVAFMVKRSDPRFADTGGWEFLDFAAAPAAVPPTGRSAAPPADSPQDQCATCHRGARRDYVFGPYPNRPREDRRLRLPPPE